MCVFVYACVYAHACTCLCVYVYVYVRETERQRKLCDADYVTHIDISSFNFCFLFFGCIFQLYKKISPDHILLAKYTNQIY